MLTDHRGNDQGSLSVVLTPCTKKGSPLGDDYFVEDPKELLDKGICLILYLIALLREKTRRRFGDASTSEVPYDMGHILSGQSSKRLMKKPFEIIPTWAVIQTRSENTEFRPKMSSSKRC